MYDFIEVETSKIFNMLPILDEAMPEFLKRSDVTWEPRHVYGALFLGVAQLSLIIRDEEPIGFIITRWMIDSQTAERYLHIWLFYLFKQHRGQLKELVEPAFNYLMNYCRNGGGKYMEMQTLRADGWGKYISKYMPPIFTTFRKRI